MAYINWSEDFSVKVREIDDQHKYLVDRINELHQAMLDQKAREIQKAVIDAMVDYAVAHFEAEERYMRRVKFPGYPEHKKEHELFTAKAIELQERVNKSGFILSLEVLTFLKTWLQDHILGTDKKYSNHFNDNGIR